MDETGHPEPVQFPYSHLFKKQKSQGLTVSLSTKGTALATAYESNNEWTFLASTKDIQGIEENMYLNHHKS